MKKFSLLLLTVLLTFGLVACGGGGGGGDKPEAKEEPAYYVVDSMTIEGEELTHDDLVAMLGSEEALADFMCVGFIPGGTCIMAMEDDVVTGTFTEEGDAYVCTFENEGESEKITYTKDGDKLNMTADGEEGTIVFAKTDKAPAILNQDPLALFAPNFDSDDTDEMNTFMLRGRYYFDDGKLYGHFFSDKSACLGIREYEEEDPTLGEVTVLDKNCRPTYVCEEDGYIYYVRTDNEDDAVSLCRVKKDGGDVETLYDDTCEYVQIVEDTLYFTDKDGKMTSADLNGKNQKTVLDKEIYYAYWVDEDFLLYQDDADGETIHIYYAPTAADAKLTDDRSLCPVISGNTLWYVKDEGADGKDFHLAKMDLASKKEEVSENTLSDASFMLRDDGYIFMGAYNEEDTDAITMVKTDKWKDLKGAAIDWEKSYTEREAVDGSYQVSWDDEGNGIKLYFWFVDYGESN